MQKSRKAAAIALALFLCSAVPSFAARNRDGGVTPEDPISRIIRVIKRTISPIVHVLDDLSIPKP